MNFYLGFSLMGLAAYGLVIHDGKQASLHAGRIYLMMTLVAETALFAALLLIHQHSASLAPTPQQLMGLSDWAIGLLIFGLGIKAGLILLPFSFEVRPNSVMVTTTRFSHWSSRSR